MTFTPEQKQMLDAKLNGALVKTRKQSGQTLSYIEGWRAIDEANRIFGFDGWTRETLSTECVYSGEYQKAVWENGRKTDKTVPAFRCTYHARVRVTAGGVFRDGTGSGHGFGENPGDAHESAVKESETDAMKRALMTFGNPFGLALYDKDQTDVEHGNHRPPVLHNGTAPRPRVRDEAFFKRESYELKPSDFGNWTRWAEAFRAAASDCKLYAEWVRLEDDNLSHRNAYADKAPAAAVNDLLAFSNRINDQLNPALKP